MKILLLNSDKKFFSLVKNSLKDDNLVHTASIFTAKEYIIHEQFDAVLAEFSDVDSTATGMELLKILTASDIGLPIIMLFQDADISQAVECVKMGALDCLEKNLEPDILNKRIREILEKVFSNKPKNNSNTKEKNKLMKFLFVDDNEVFTKNINFALKEKYNLDIINNFSSVVKRIKEVNYDIIFLDIKDEKNSDPQAGIKLLKEIKNINEDITIIMLSGWADMSTAIECLKSGAVDFIEKSLDFSKNIERINEIIEKSMDKSRPVHFSGDKNPDRYRVIDLIGECCSIKNIRSEIIEIANHNVPVLINGETGTGKGIVASAIHTASSRRNKPLIIVDCSAIPESIFESEFFGYHKGAFTGASQNQRGKMEAAHEGTLFLDEVENLSLEHQAKLLRVLEDKTILPLGSTKTIAVDFRLICATNVDLQEMVNAGKFREDLLYRINVYNFTLPALRDRGIEEIYLLIQHFQWEYKGLTIEPGAIELLQKYYWPGNVRELKNLLKKLTIIARGRGASVITLDIVKEGFARLGSNARIDQLIREILYYSNGNVAAIFKEMEDIAVLDAWKEFNGNISKIARRVYNESPEDCRNHRDKVRFVIERNKHLFN